MSILSDRRSLREIGGLRAYVVQVGWSLWWRTQDSSSPDGARRLPEAEAISSGRGSSGLSSPTPRQHNPS